MQYYFPLLSQPYYSANIHTVKAHSNNRSSLYHSYVRSQVIPRPLLRRFAKPLKQWSMPSIDIYSRPTYTQPTMPTPHRQRRRMMTVKTHAKCFRDFNDKTQANTIHTLFMSISQQTPHTTRHPTTRYLPRSLTGPPPPPPASEPATFPSHTTQAISSKTVTTKSLAVAINKRIARRREEDDDDDDDDDLLVPREILAWRRINRETHNTHIYTHMHRRNGGEANTCAHSQQQQSHTR